MCAVTHCKTRGLVCTHELSIRVHSQPCRCGDLVGQPLRPSLHPANGAPNKGCAIAELSNTGEIGRRLTSAGKSPTMHFYPMDLRAT